MGSASPAVDGYKIYASRISISVTRGKVSISDCGVGGTDGIRTTSGYSIDGTVTSDGSIQCGISDIGEVGKDETGG